MKNGALYKKIMKFGEVNYENMIQESFCVALRDMLYDTDHIEIILFS